MILRKVTYLDNEIILMRILNTNIIQYTKKVNLLNSSEHKIYITEIIISRYINYYKKKGFQLKYEI